MLEENLLYFQFVLTPFYFAMGKHVQTLNRFHF